MSFIERLNQASLEGQTYVEAKEQEKMRKELKQHDHIKGMIDKIIDDMFPTEEELLKYARTNKERKMLIFDIKMKDLCIACKKIKHQVSMKPYIIFMPKDFHHGVESHIPYFETSMKDPMSKFIQYIAPNVNYIYERLKNKTLSELGKPKFDDAKKLLWYEW